MDAAGGRAIRLLVASISVIAVNVLTALLVVPSSAVADDDSGDILVAVADGFGGPCPSGCGGVVRVDPETGAQTTVSSGGSFVEPWGITIDDDGDVLVADLGAFGGGGGVIRVDPETGAQTTVSSGGSFDGPIGITIDDDG
ncbi:MAG: hypothetical protein ACT4PO_01670 [Actinomycetota bacterium]